MKSVVWGDRTVSFTVAKALVHMATHETHHRGLVIGLIRQLGYEPPDVDML
ncbi:MAG: DinB family protein [Candidatus Thorarchaeota archaeon]